MVAPLALLINVEELAPVAQVLDEFPVAVDVGVEMAELPEQRARSLGVAWVEFAHLGVEQVGEEEGAVFSVGGWSVGVKPAPLIGCLARHKRPADGLGVGEDLGLGGFLFCGGWHGVQRKGQGLRTGVRIVENCSARVMPTRSDRRA